MRDDRSLREVVLSDGRFLIALTGISLSFAGAFAILQSVSGQLLPQDTHALGMDSVALMRAANPRLLALMLLDRVAYGGTLTAIGLGYLWLAAFPMKSRETWVWWALLFSGGMGFLAFLTYLGQGYLETWHGVATVFLLPVFVMGLWSSRPDNYSLRAVWMHKRPSGNRLARWGRLLLGACAAGLILAGFAIAVLGMTSVLLPSELRFIGLGVPTLRHISPMLVLLISHDRAGFGGALCSAGYLLLFMARCADLNRSLVEIVAAMGMAGFFAAIGVHVAVGYVDRTPMLPAILGFALFVAAVALLLLGWRRQIQAERMARTSQRVRVG